MEMTINKIIKDSKKDLLAGKINTIPFPYAGTRKSLSGTYKGALSCITAETSVGKTSLAKHLYLFYVADLMLDMPKYQNLKYRCLWFGLEESFNEFQCSVIQYALRKYFNIFVTQDELLSRISPLEDSIERLIYSDEVQNYLTKVLELVDFQDDISNPTGIYMYCKEYSKKIGEHYYKKVPGLTEEVYDYYKQHDPELLISVVIDNVNILESELGLTLDQCIGKLVDTYCRKNITKHWNWHVCCLQQQAMAAGNLEHFKANKLEPSPQKLGDNLKVARSYQIIIGLFSPHKHGLPHIYGYQISDTQEKPGLEDCFRSLHILKNRFGRTGTIEPLFFNPKGFYFRSLPKVDDPRFLEFLELKKEILK